MCRNTFDNTNDFEHVTGISVSTFHLRIGFLVLLPAQIIQAKKYTWLMKNTVATDEVIVGKKYKRV